ncbi:PTS cellobiose transporter subunit IIA [Companilactobacillus sp. RD055328]|uniref:PTS lactose/cellobiose transporter subunit IIA n=1 Tax=Companilactobacillus sp. RD055328 TaxID=2916634 RepID=UPI001FC8AEFF|nr:PTS lactose/cellobiose transporter subunit IIA [Companilactobacillus sp. RD055328]GKQ43447.1 PTS cellobiose transporter subunit IIA [Companilactobacillus sp. RD055328]
MDGLEKVAFDIISNTGEARSILMNIIKEVEKGNFDSYEEEYKKANDCLKTASKVHLQLISSEAQQKEVPFNLLLVHAEDQMMAAELVRDLTEHIVHLNKELYALKEDKK